MSFGAIAPAALGSITQPTSVVLGTPAAVSMPSGFDGARWGEYQAIPLPQANAVIFCHGTEAMRYAREGGSYRLGLLAPDTGMTAASTGVKKFSILTLTGDPANNDEILLGINSAPLDEVYFKTTLDTTIARAQVKRGTSQDATLSNLQKLIEGTGTNGVEYYDGFNVSTNGFYDPNFWHTTMGIEAPSANLDLTANTLKIQSTTSGTSGVTLNSSEVTDTGNVMSFSATPNMTGGAIGTGSAPSAGDYDYSVAALRSGDNALSGRSLPVVSISQDGNYNVSLAAAPAFVTRDATDNNRWFRTLVGAVQMFKVKDTTTTTATDDVSDSTLGDKLLRYQYRDELQRPRISGYPVVKRFGVMWRGRLWGVGASKWADYTKGTVAVTQGSATVTFSAAAHVKEDWIGRFIRIAATTTDYRIVDVDASANTAKLGQPYVETTNGTASYVLTDARASTDLDFSEPQALNTSVNNWPVNNNLGGVQSKTIVGGTGVAVDAQDNLIVTTLTGAWRVSGSPGAFSVKNVGEGCGCFCGQAIQQADGGILYWLGPDGVQAWTGTGTPKCLSKPPDGPASGIQGTIDLINGDEATIICSNYNPSVHRIRWWIPYDGSVSNNRCLRLDLQTGEFALHTASDVTSACTMPGPGGTQVTVTGDLYGHIAQVDCGYIDGAYGFEPTGSVSSYTVATRTLAITGPTLPTTGDGLSGIPILIYLPSTGDYEMAKIESNTSGAVVLTAPLTTTPTSSYKVVVGGIPFDCVSGSMNDGHPEIPKWLEAMTLDHEVESAATEVWVGAASDNDSPSIYPAGSYCDMTETDGEHHFWLRTLRGRSLQFRILAFARGYRVRLRGYALSIRSQSTAEVEG